MPTYSTMPYYDPKLNTPELVASRRDAYLKNGGNLSDPDTSGGEYQPTLPPGTAGITDGDPSLNGGAGSSFQLPSWLQNIIGGVGQGLTNATTSPMLAPALATAYQYYNNADKYGNMAENFSKEANPFGDRSQYVQGLSDLYRDPSSIENSSAYQFRLNQGLNTLGPQQAAKGAGYGNAARAMMDYASGLASTEYDKEWQRRYEAAGGKFDPANSVQAQLNAYKLETDAKNAALGALFTPFAPQPGGTTINNNNSGGSSNTGGGGNNPINKIPGVSLPIGSGGSSPPWLTTAGTAGSWITSGINKGMWQMNDGTVIDTDKLYAAAAGGDPEAIQISNMISQAAGLGTGNGNFDWDNGTGIGITDPVYSGESPMEPPIEAPVDPMPDDYIYEGLDFWMEP